MIKHPAAVVQSTVARGDNGRVRRAIDSKRWLFTDSICEIYFVKTDPWSAASSRLLNVRRLWNGLRYRFEEYNELKSHGEIGAERAHTGVWSRRVEESVT